MDGDGEGVADVEATGDVGGRAGDDERSFGLRLSVGSHGGREEALGVPPVVPR